MSSLSSKNNQKKRRFYTNMLDSSNTLQSLRHKVRASTNFEMPVISSSCLPQPPPLKWAVTSPSLGNCSEGETGSTSDFNTTWLGPNVWVGIIHPPTMCSRLPSSKTTICHFVQPSMAILFRATTTRVSHLQRLRCQGSSRVEIEPEKQQSYAEKTLLHRRLDLALLEASEASPAH